MGLRLANLTLCVTIAATSTSLAQDPLRDVEVVPDPSLNCSDCATWNAERAPFKVYGNTYYVGVAGLSAILVVTSKGLVLIDGALPQSAPLIAEHIRALGFRVADIRLILNSHVHSDHAGGLSALQRASGAAVAASESAVRALALGHATEDDPQYDLVDAATTYKPIAGVEVVGDGQIRSVGDVEFTAHLTPGHTPGSTTWTWRSCETGRCLNVVYADSLNAVSAPGFRFTGAENYASRVDAFRKSISTVADLPCDVLLAPHPGFFGIDKKLAARAANPASNPFVDSNACRAYAERAGAVLDRRVAEERAR